MICLLTDKGLQNKVNVKFANGIPTKVDLGFHRRNACFPNQKCVWFVVFVFLCQNLHQEAAQLPPSSPLHPPIHIGKLREMVSKLFDRFIPWKQQNTLSNRSLNNATFEITWHRIKIATKETSISGATGVQQQVELQLVQGGIGN